MRPIGLRNYLAQAYASTRGSAPALRTPVFGSMAMAAFDPNDHAPADCNLCPLARSAFRTASGIRDSTDRSPGRLMLCGNTEDAKPRVDHRGASIACWTFMPKSIMFMSVWTVRGI